MATAFDLPELTAGIFGNSYIFKDHKIKLDPTKAYRDRPGYQVRDSDGFTEESRPSPYILEIPQAG